MVPLRTGIVRDIRIEVYNKVLKLPLSFFFGGAQRGYYCKDECGRVGSREFTDQFTGYVDS